MEVKFPGRKRYVTLEWPPNLKINMTCNITMSTMILDLLYSSLEVYTDGVYRD